MNFWTKIRQSLFIEQNVSVLSLTVLFVLMAFFSWYPVLPIYLKELGANDFQVGFSYTLLTLSWQMIFKWDFRIPCLPYLLL
jgi:hypothetical protein